MSFWDIFKTVKKPKKKEREKWLKQVEKAKKSTKANAKTSRKSASPKPHKTTSSTTSSSKTSSKPSYSSSRRGGYVSTNVQKRARTQSDNTLKAHSAYSARLKKEREAENRKAVKALQKYTGHKYKNNEEIKGTIYTGDPEQYKPYSISAKAKDDNADKTVYKKKSGTSKGVTLKEYYSQKEHKKEAQKAKKETEDFINNNPFMAGFGDAYSGLAGRGVEGYKDIFKNVKGKDGKKGLDTKKYDKSSAAKAGNVLGTVSQYVITGGTGGAYKAGASATAKALGKLAGKKAVKSVAKKAAKEVAKTTAKKGAKKLTKEGVKKFAKDRAAEVAADMPLDVAHSYKDSKGDTKEFIKQMGLNIGMNIGAGAGVAGIGKTLKAVKAKSALKKVSRKETAKAVKKTLDVLDKRAKDQGDYLRPKMGAKNKAVKGKVKGRTLVYKNKKTGKVIYEGSPKTPEQQRVVLRHAMNEAGGIDNLKAETGSPQARVRKETEKLTEAPKGKEVKTTGKPIEEPKAKTSEPKAKTSETTTPTKATSGEPPKNKAPESGKLYPDDVDKKIKSLETERDKVGEEYGAIFLKKGDGSAEAKEVLERYDKLGEEINTLKKPYRGNELRANLKQAEEKLADIDKKIYKADHTGGSYAFSDRASYRQLRYEQEQEIERIKQELADIGEPVPEPKAEPLPQKTRTVKDIDNDIKSLQKNKQPESELDKEWKAKGREYGTYDKANTPKQTDETTKVNKALDTAMSEKPGREGIVRDERVKQNIKRSVLEQEVGFTRSSQRDALDAAYKRVDKDPEAVRKQFNETLTAKDSDIANGVALYDHYMKQGDIEAASDVIKKVSMQLTEAGRTTNAAKMLMKATPAGRVKAVQGLAEKLTERFKKRLKGEDITLSDETIKRINDAKTEKEILEANEAARVEIWDQIPASWGEKFNAWRYIAMLANPKTHVRNIIGNALFAVPREVKNIIGTGVESLAEKAKLIEKGDRTKALINPFKESDKKLLDFGGKNFDVNEPILRGQSRWNDSARAEDSVVFKNPILEKLRKMNGGVLDKEDIIFMKPAYKRAMARYMKANGYTAADMTGNVLKKAEAIASDEALKATYRDANAFASWLTKTKNVAPDASLPRKLGAITVESMVPFAKTPTNILRRGVEYSPIGLMHGMTNIGRALARKDGRMLVQAIDRMTAGLTGSGVLALGYLLNKNGIVTVDVGSDSEGNFRKGLGEQSYALKLGDSSYTLDWAAPMSMPFFVGANISDQTQNHDLSMKDVLNSFGDMMNPVAEMSMLQGLTSTLGAVRSSKSGGAMLEDIALGITTNYASQAIPTISGQLARVFDNTQRSTTSTEEGNAVRKLDKFQKQMRAKIPGLSRTLEPALDSWGNKKKYGSTKERVLENFISPGYYSENKATPVDKKLLKLADDLSEDERSLIFPKGKTGGYNLPLQGKDVRMTPQALTTYNKVKGKEAYKKVKALMSTDEYKKMSQTDKVKAITNIYTDAGVWAKQESLIKMGKDKFKVRTDDWKNKDAVKAAKQYDDKHDIDDIVGINKQLDDLGFSTSRNRQTNIKAIAVADSGKANKDLYKYYNVDKATQKTIKQYKAAGGSLGELGDVQKSIDATAKTVGKRANKLPKGALAFALSSASGKNRIYQMYDESTPKSKGYWEHSVRSGKGMAATGLTLKDRQKAYDATKGASGHPSKDAIVKYLNGTNYTQEQKSYLFWQLATWNTSENPYGEYTPKFKAKKSKTAGKVDWSKKKTLNEYTKAAKANADDEFWTRYRFAKQAEENAKTKKTGISAPHSDEDYIPKRALEVQDSYDKEGIEKIKEILGGYPKRMSKRLIEAAKKSPKIKDDSDTIYGDGKEGSSSGGGGRGYYRRYGRGGRGGRGGGSSSGGGLDFPELKTAKTTTPSEASAKTPTIGTAKSKSVDWTPKMVSTKPGWTDAQIRKVFNALISQGLTREQAVSRIASLWNTRFG